MCGVSLPPPQPMVGHSMEVEQRLFFALRDTPEYPSSEMLIDLFGRFGDLVNANRLKGKRCGYVRYGSLASAERAIQGSAVCRVC